VSGRLGYGLVRSTKDPDPPVGDFLLLYPKRWFTAITSDAINVATATRTLKLSCDKKSTNLTFKTYIMVQFNMKTCKNKLADLFGDALPQKKRMYRRHEKGLLQYDKMTFDERLRRLTYISQIYPKELLLKGDMEFVFTFNETKVCFINGHYISTIILAQSFIEKFFYDFFIRNNLKKQAASGLAGMIKYAKQNNLIDTFILKKVEDLRLKRNPFIHPKDWNYPHDLSERMQRNKTQPHEQLEKDATEAIQVMFTLARLKL